MEPAHLGTALWEIGGALVLGLGLGLPAAYLTGRLEQGEPQMTEALGMVFLAAGLASWSGVSFLIWPGWWRAPPWPISPGITSTAFHEIEHVQWPFLILFFVLAGASLEVGPALAELGLIGGAYVALRIAADSPVAGSAARSAAPRGRSGRGSGRRSCRRQGWPWAWRWSRFRTSRNIAT